MRRLATVFALASLVVVGTAGLAGAESSYDDSFEYEYAAPSALGTGTADASADADRATGSFFVRARAKEGFPVASPFGLTTSSAYADAGFMDTTSVSGGDYQVTAAIDDLVSRARSYGGTVLSSSEAGAYAYLDAFFVCESGCESGPWFGWGWSDSETLDPGSDSVELSTFLSIPSGASGTLRMQLGISASAHASSGAESIARVSGTVTDLAVAAAE